MIRLFGFSAAGLCCGTAAFERVVSDRQRPGLSQPASGGVARGDLKRNRGLVVFDKNCYLAEAHWRASNVYDDPAYRNEWPLTDKRRLTGNWYCLMGHWGSNYNHWMWDELPRLFSALPHLPGRYPVCGCG